MRPGSTPNEHGRHPVNRGLDKLFDIPLIGLLLHLLFSERMHVALAAIFSLGGLCWLINLLIESPQFDTIARYLMFIPLSLFGIWIICVLLFLLLEKLFFPNSGPGRGMREKTIDKEIKKALRESPVHPLVINRRKQ